MRGYRKRVLGLAIGVALLAVPASAGAAVTIGSNLSQTPNASLLCGGPCTVVSSVIPAADQAPRGVTSPIDGVVVRWRIRVGGSTGPVQLRVLAPAGGDARTGAGTGPVENPPANAISTFNAQLPIHAGDNVGLDQHSAAVFSYAAGGTGTRLEWEPALPDGTTASPLNVRLDRQVLLNADIEPDCDNDGLGDESQDSDLSACDPPAGDTAPPNTTITAVPGKRRAKHSFFQFSSSEPGSRFRCALDGGPDEPCTSPQDYRNLKRGSHTFAVFAIDAAGNADPTPATHEFRIKKKKK